jgi:small subunit ribosomal protein S6
MKGYELLFIVPTSYTEEELGTVEQNVVRLIEKNGATIEKTTRLGKFRFAYPIRHERFGHYILMRLKAEPSAIAGIESGLRMNQKEILRHLILSAEEVSDSFNLVQFQEVRVEGGGEKRRKPQAKEADQPAKEEAVREQKEGVAAIEAGAAPTEEPREPIQDLSAEDLQKKIDEALTEEAK